MIGSGSSRLVGARRSAIIIIDHHGCLLGTLKIGMICLIVHYRGRIHVSKPLLLLFFKIMMIQLL